VTQKIIDPWNERFLEPLRDEAAALKAIAVGEASPEQQKKGLHWIIHRCSGANLDTFAPGHPDVSVYRQGRASVGLDMMQILLRKLDTFKSKNPEK